MGPVVQALYELAPELLDELEIWCVGTFPLDHPPQELLTSLKAKRRLLTIEEHYRACGLGEALSHLLLQRGAAPEALRCLSAAGYPSGRYGSQRFHQEESGL